MNRRRREKKTDYRQRLALLKSRKVRLVVRRNLNNIHVQLVNYEKNGDKTLAEEISKSLVKYGWKGHKGNIAAAYLTGLIIGFKAAKNGIKEATLDAGLQISTKGSSIYAVVAGARDAGLDVPVNEEMLPSKERTEGAHTANLAKILKPKQDSYKRQFSAYLKNGLDPEKLPDHFREVKDKIMKDFVIIQAIRDQENYLKK